MAHGPISFQLMAGMYIASQWLTSKNVDFIVTNQCSRIASSKFQMPHSFSDQYDDDAWHSIPTSFQNLGRSRNRCWPWTEDHSLPYRRTGADAPVWGKSAFSLLHQCLDRISNTDFRQWAWRSASGAR